MEIEIFSDNGIDERKWLFFREGIYVCEEIFMGDFFWVVLGCYEVEEF